MAIQSPSRNAARPIELDREGLRERASGASPRVRYRDTTDYQHRNFVNLAATAALLVVALGVAWTVKEIEAQQKMENCLYSGRRDCLELNIPQQQRHAIRPPTR